MRIVKFISGKYGIRKDVLLPDETTRPRFFSFCNRGFILKSVLCESEDLPRVQRTLEELLNNAEIEADMGVYDYDRR